MEAEPRPTFFQARATALLAAIMPAIVFCAVYLPRVGHGFILDDYRWVLESRVSSLSQFWQLFIRENGFYRPLVSASFSFDYWLFDLDPIYYGLTNVFIAVVCGILLYRVARLMNLPWGAAAAAAALWMLSFHGTEAALLWISGRTSLLATAGALCAGLAVLRRRFMLGAIAVGLALLSKEEALSLPIVLILWIWLSGRELPERSRDVKTWIAWCLPVVVAYLVMRGRSGAMTISTAPSYYRYTTEPLLLLRNIGEYADRTLTLPVVTAAIAAGVLRPQMGQWRRFWSKWGRVAISGACWLVGCFGLTIALPVRSSLYACLPSVGACLMGASVLTWLWSRAVSQRRLRACQMAIVLSVIAGIILYLRTDRMVTLAEVSQRIWTSLPSLTAATPDGSFVRVVDDPSKREGIRSAFGSLLAEAYELRTGRHLRFWIEPPVPEQGEPPCDSCVARVVIFREGALFSQGVTDAETSRPQ
jgi:hypothetical protein